MSVLERTVGMQLQELGATYRQFDYWCRMGWIPGLHSFGIGKSRITGEGYNAQWQPVPRFTPEQAERIEALAEASRIKRMPLNELADFLAKL